MRGREYDARMRRLADLATEEKHHALSLLLTILRDVDDAANRAPALETLATEEHPDTAAPALCRIAAGVMRATARADVVEVAEVVDAPVAGARRPVADQIRGKTFKYARAEHTIGVNEYASGRLRVSSSERHVEHLTTDEIDDVNATPADDEIYVLIANEHESLARAALASGLFEDTGRSVLSGYTQAAVWRVKPVLGRGGS
jgi:hypothetical protein